MDIEKQNKTSVAIPVGKGIEFAGARRSRNPISNLAAINKAAHATNKTIPDSDALYLNSLNNQSRELILDALTPENRVKFLELENEIEKIYAEGRDLLRRQRAETLRLAEIAREQEEAESERLREETAQAILDAENGDGSDGIATDGESTTETPEPGTGEIQGDGSGDALPPIPFPIDNEESDGLPEVHTQEKSADSETVESITGDEPEPDLESDDDDENKTGDETEQPDAVANDNPPEQLTDDDDDDDGTGTAHSEDEMNAAFMAALEEEKQ